MMTAEERLSWLIDRQAGIGSSDAPNLCGVGYRTAADVYASKTEPITIAKANYMPGFLKRGTVMEPLVAQEYSELMEIELVTVPTERHPERPWQIANIDRAAVDGSRDVELKTVAGFGFEWGGSGTDDFPEGYRIQCQHQMGVRGKEYCDLAALDVITWELRVYRLTFSPFFFEWLTHVEEQAWKMIEARQPIGPEWEKQWEAGTKERLETSDAIGKLPPEVLPILQKRHTFGEIQKEAKAEYDALTDQLKSHMGDMYKAEIEGWRLTNSFIKAMTITSERKEHYRLLATPPSDKPAKTSKTRKAKVFQ